MLETVEIGRTTRSVRAGAGMGSSERRTPARTAQRAPSARRTSPRGREPYHHVAMQVPFLTLSPGMCALTKLQSR